MESEILQGLSEAQRAAVVNYDRPSLIIAGAGSGKTRVLTSRIAYMIEQGVPPHRILALTFTNKAAAEMRARIEQMVGDRSRYIRMGTFHSVFSRILRENAERIGYPSSFTIYEPNDVKNLLKTIVREMNLAEEKYKPNTIASRISQAKNSLITPGAYLLQANILLKDCPDVLARYQEQFRYILVDEYQDTNYAQYIIIRRLSQQHGMVCVVGDDAQSIYSFRGAKIENILSFQQDYPQAEVFKLEQNYRSTRTIVEAANSVINHNARRMQKTCFSEGERGEKIRILRAYTDREEAEMVISELRDRIRATGSNWSDAVILYRTNSQSAVLEENLRRRGIPYRIYKGSSFYDHKEIRDLMGYIRLVVNPRDDEAFKRIVNWPARGIGETTVDRIAAIAASRGCSMWEAVDRLVEEPAADAVQRAIIRKVTEFVQMIRALSMARTQLGLYELGLEIASRSGLLALYRADTSPEAASALANIEELLNSMQLFREQRDAEIRNGERPAGEEATIEEWLQGVMLMTDMDKEDPEDRNKVTLMTVHSAKGLEYDYVYIVGLEENLFPSQRAAESPEGMEEERRLFYVALTRAKVAAVISYAEMRFKWGNMEFSRPSCFLREIDPQYVESEVDFSASRSMPEPERGEGAAIDELRRRFDYRLQRQRQEGGEGRSRNGYDAGRSGGAPGSGRSGGYGTSGGSGYGAGRRSGGASAGYEGRFGARPSDGESGMARRFTAAGDPYRAKQYPHPGTKLDDRIERAAAALGADQRRTLRPLPTNPAKQANPMPGASMPGVPAAGASAAGGLSSAGSAGGGVASAGGYAVGDRVEHARFGGGVIQRIEQQTNDLKLTVEFGSAGSKTLLARFAKLRKL